MSDYIMVTENRIKKIIETPSGQVIFKTGNMVEAKTMVLKLNKNGTGFQGNTPQFFTKGFNYDNRIQFCRGSSG